MKIFQILVAYAVLTGYAQACTRIRVDQWRDPSDSSLKHSTITAFDENKPAIGTTDFRSTLDKSAETWVFRESNGQVDVSLNYDKGIFGKKISGTVAFPQAKGYIDGSNHLQLEQKAEYTYTTQDQIEHHVYCLWDNYKFGGYNCPAR